MFQINHRVFFDFDRVSEKVCDKFDMNEEERKQTKLMIETAMYPRLMDEIEGILCANAISEFEEMLSEFTKANGVRIELDSINAEKIDDEFIGFCAQLVYDETHRAQKYTLCRRLDMIALNILNDCTEYALYRVAKDEITGSINVGETDQYVCFKDIAEYINYSVV